MAKRLVIHGLVQGVGYRVYFAESAASLGLCGWVRNLHDGSVEACVHGDDDAIATMITWAERGPPAARVSKVDVFSFEGPAPLHNKMEILATA